jgi:simple sugar transport system ATP-binding protein
MSESREGPFGVVELRGVSKRYGAVNALQDVSLTVAAGEVTCVLGDNGAGKSTLIKILSGRIRPSAGEYRVDGEPVQFDSPRQALDAGIAAVYQDLAVVPLMSVWRNFFLGNELTGRFGRLRADEMRAVTRSELAGMGIDLPDVEQPIGELSGGQRQSVAIARAVHFGARVLILDEPTAALGVKQAGVVLKHIAAARERGSAVIFITHNPHHAFPLGDRFTVLQRGAVLAEYERGAVTLDELTRDMSGGAELEALAHELGRPRG